MYKISEEKEFNMEINTLFDFTQNFEERIKWDSQTKAITFMNNELLLKEGVQVAVTSNKGLRMETEYLTFEKPHELSIKMINSSPIFKTFKGKWEYKESPNRRTIIKITYLFELKFPYEIINSIVSKKIRKNINTKLHNLNQIIVNR
jgi:ribosome-associated toxin RatA of RatAB toxin-antitoxin module